MAGLRDFFHVDPLLLTAPYRLWESLVIGSLKSSVSAKRGTEWRVARAVYEGNVKFRNCPCHFIRSRDISASIVNMLWGGRPGFIFPQERGILIIHTDSRFSHRSVRC